MFHSLTGGGCVISPVNEGKQSVVKHMLAIDWKFWKSYLRPSTARSITIKMLGRVAGTLQLWIIYIYIYICDCLTSQNILCSMRITFVINVYTCAALRELFRAKLGYPSSDFSSGELTRNHPNQGSCRSDVQLVPGDVDNKGNVVEEVDKTSSDLTNLVNLNDTSDEFFDVPETSGYDQSEADWIPDFVPDMYSRVNTF